ncbi:hypothetical protein DPEC_G00245990 [Dallia pectoralis]|uniref:Uncharacterized protein n=1 Tax=Dallia pectoralis TaxID=75939 RepID=A0ACC2FVY9_DALPE|nr:hypothetical protein DPEC_G00245990 [Dallia pectoralis]
MAETGFPGVIARDKEDMHGEGAGLFTTREAAPLYSSYPTAHSIEPLFVSLLRGWIPLALYPASPHSC